MKKYDIVFVGHTAKGEIIPFKGIQSLRTGGGAAFFGAAAALCCTTNIAMITKMSIKDEHFIDPLKKMGFDIYVQHSAETTHMKVVYPTSNVDIRQIFQISSAGFFRIEDMPPIEPCLIHLGGLGDREFNLEFMKGLKERGFLLSIDIQSFIWDVDKDTGAIRYKDLQDKEEILHMIEIIKLDVAEAKALTGTDDPVKAASIIDDWGCSETIITNSKGVLAYKEGERYFAEFSNKSVQGRTGRGDTTIGAYLARRINHSVEESVKFTAALVSIKMETEGHFTGTIKDVLARMETTRCYSINQ